MPLQIFRGNFDRHTVVAYRFVPPFKAQYARVHPKTWRGGVSMRLEFYGCASGEFLLGELFVELLRFLSVPGDTFNAKLYWPLAKRVGNWVGISNAKALGIVWKDKTSKIAATLRLWLLVQPATQQLYCRGIFSSPCSNPVPSNDPKRHCGIDSDPAPRSFW